MRCFGRRWGREHGQGAAGEEEEGRGGEHASVHQDVHVRGAAELYVDDMLIRNCGDVGHVVRETEKAGHGKVDADMVAECLELLDARGRTRAEKRLSWFYL